MCTRGGISSEEGWLSPQRRLKVGGGYRPIQVWILGMEGGRQIMKVKALILLSVVAAGLLEGLWVPPMLYPRPEG